MMTVFEKVRSIIADTIGEDEENITLDTEISVPGLLGKPKQSTESATRGAGFLMNLMFSNDPIAKELSEKENIQLPKVDPSSLQSDDLDFAIVMEIYLTIEDEFGVEIDVRPDMTVREVVAIIEEAIL